MRVLHKTLLLMLFVLTTICGAGETPDGDQTGLFFDKDDVPMLRDRFQNDPIFTEYRKELQAFDREKERSWMRSEVRYNDHLYDVPRLHNLAERMAFIYLFTGDKDAADLAIEAVETLMKFPIWDYFEENDAVMGLQRAPGSTVAVVICAEVLGDVVGEKTVKRWIRMMGEKGCEPSFLSTYGMRHPESVKGWHFTENSTYFEHRPGDRGLDLSRWPHILNTINLKAVPAGALALGALAHQKYLGENDDNRRWLEQAVFSIRTFKDIFERDGSYDEGVSYAHYTTLHLAQAIVAIQRRKGQDLADIINWPGYATYLREMTLPTAADPYEIVNFSDAGRGALSSVAFWAAAHTRDGEAQWFAENLARGHDAWSLLWRDNSVKVTEPASGPVLWKSDLDWMVARTGYKPNDLVLALRSGPPANHEHADRNSIILKSFGEQLVTDPHRPPYAFVDPAWSMRLTSGHSAVLIDGKGHQYHDGREGTNASDAHANIVRSGANDTFMYFTSDGTPAYKLVHPDLESITRTAVVVPSVPAVILMDKVVNTSKASLVQARFFAYNNDGKGRVEGSGASFRTSRPLATLHGRAHSSRGVAVESKTLPIPEEKAKMYPFAEISTSTAASEVLLISVLLPERGAGGFSEAKFQQIGTSDAGWEVDLRNGNGSAMVRIYDTGSIPEFEVHLR